jgi:butyrate kinase
MAYKLLVINPGSTSTKVAVYLDREQQWVESISHSPEELKPFNDVYDQLDFRTDLVVKCYEKHGDKVDDFDAVVARGGLMPPVHAGAYEVNQYMIDMMHYHPQNSHASNMAAAIAQHIAKDAGCKAYTYDAVAVDEMEGIVRITGLKEIERYGRGHNLNMRAAVINFCEQNGINMKEKNIMSVHMGGGISIGLISNGRIIDMISDDEGPFSPERSGGLPAFRVIDLCYDEYPNKKAMMNHLKNEAGFMSHLGTTDLREVQKMIEDGDEHAKLIFDAMALNIAKNIAKLTVDVDGKIDYILLTGGMAYSDMLTDEIKKHTEWIAPVELMPGEKEMDSLAFGILRVLNGKETADILEGVCEK